MEIKQISGGICAPKGFRASGIHCGIRKNPLKKDLALIVSDTVCTAAAVYTKNKVFGAPITVTRAHLSDGHAQAVICNSGNANTCNADGVEKANRMAKLTADALGIRESDVIVGSTGVIGQTLDLDPIKSGMPLLTDRLTYDGSLDAAQAIMTTDTAVKEAARAMVIDGRTVTMGAIAKGSGMIHPNMATMLCFITTDAAISPELLDTALHTVVDDTFNMISIDGDSSTNDTVAILANGMAGNAEITDKGEAFDCFCAALRDMATVISRGIAKDGEGATKLLECVVSGVKDVETAKTIAKSVIASSLVKAAMFGSDANWGRVLCAMGYSGAEFDPARADVTFQSAKGILPVCVGGAGIAFSEEKAKELLLEDEIAILVSLHAGSASATAWGCDLSYEYVKINGDYRT